MRPFILILFVALMIGPPTLASDVVSQFVGDWTGEGLVRPKGFDAQVVVRCRISGKKMSTTQVSFSGRCATANGTGAFNILIAQDAQGHAFAAKGKFSEIESWVDFSGTGDKTSVVLIQKKLVVQNGDLWLSEITLSFQTNGAISFKNKLSSITTDHSVLSFSVVFRRHG